MATKASNEKFLVDYTIKRKKAGVIEECPKCGRKGKLEYRATYTAVEVYVHKETHKYTKFFNHIDNQEKCTVPHPLKNAFYESVAEYIKPIIEKPDSQLRVKIIEAFYKNANANELVLEITIAFQDRMVRMINRDMELKRKAAEILSLFEPPSNGG